MGTQVTSRAEISVLDIDLKSSHFKERVKKSRIQPQTLMDERFSHFLGLKGKKKKKILIY